MTPPPDPNQPLPQRPPRPPSPRGDRHERRPGPAAVAYCLGWARGEPRRVLFALRVLYTPDPENLPDLANEVGLPPSTARAWHKDFLGQLQRDARLSLEHHGLTDLDWVRVDADDLPDDPERALARDR